jgi:hypothetical protein
MSDKDTRVNAVNQLIAVIGSHGRRFFWSNERQRMASIEVDARGKVWWVDDYTGKRIYTHYHYQWRGFSHGGTLKTLVEHFRDYITHGTLLPAHSFGPWPEHYCNGNLWGYGDSMQAVRDKAAELGIVRAAAALAKGG